MAYNIEMLREKYNAFLAFADINDSITKTGIMGLTDETIRQIVVVLKQSLDTANIENVDKIEYQSSDKKLVLFLKNGSIYGLIVSSKIDSIDLDAGLIKEREEKNEKPESSEDKSQKSKIVLKERKKITLKSNGRKEEEDEVAVADESKIEAKPIAETSYKSDSSAFEIIRKVASEYLEDFSDDIINNLVAEMKMNLLLMTSDDIDKFLKRLLKSSSMIIGPSSSQKMIEEIKKKIT